MRHIIAMHQLIFMRVAQLFGDFVGMAAQDFCRFGAAVIAQTARNFLAFAVHNGNQFAARTQPTGSKLLRLCCNAISAPASTTTLPAI